MSARPQVSDRGLALTGNSLAARSVPCEVRGLSDPPEARDPKDGRFFAGDAAVCTPEGLTLASLLLVTLPVTLGLSFMFAPVLLPSTALVAYAFWHLGRRVAKPGTMIVYCFGAGTFAGVLNGWLTVSFWALFFREDLSQSIRAFDIATLVGGAVGLLYGTAYLLPMLVQLSARSVRRTEALDRCLISFGLWGTLVLCLGIAAAYAYEHPLENPVEMAFVVSLASIGGHTCMLSLGVLRWARRRAWLTRVARGQVPGWLVCERQRFHQADLEQLEVFCKPLFGPKNTAGFRVLARGEQLELGDAYRNAPIAPMFLVR